MKIIIKKIGVLYLIVLMLFTSVYKPFLVSAAIPDDEIPYEFKESEKIKNKSIVRTVPKRPLTPMPGAPALLTTVLGMTPYGQEVIEQGMQAVQDLDMYLWDKLDMENWGSNIQNGFINLTDGLGETISDILKQHNEEIYPEIVMAEASQEYPFILRLLPIPDNALWVGPVYFLHDTPNNRTRVYRDYVMTNGTRTDYLSTNFSYTQGRRQYKEYTEATVSNGSNYKLNEMNKMINGYYGNYDGVSARFFFERSTIQDDELFEQDFNNSKRHHFPFMPTTHFPANVPEHLPYLNAPEVTDTSIVEIDGVPNIEITVPNPWFNPNNPIDPVTNPEELPYYTPVEVDDPTKVPTWSPGYDPYDEQGNPIPDSEIPPGTETPPGEDSGFFSSIWEWLQSFWDMLLNLLQTVLSPIINLLQAILDFLNGLLSSLWSLLETIFGPLITGVQAILNWLNGMIASLINALQDMLLMLFVPGQNFLPGNMSAMQSNVMAKFPDLALIPIAFDEVTRGCAVENIDIEIMGSKGTIFNWDYLKAAATWYKPIMSAFMIILVSFYLLRKIPAILSARGGAS